MGKPFYKPHAITGGTHVVIVGWTGVCRDRTMSAGDRWEFAAAFDIVSGGGKRRIYFTTKSGLNGSDKHVSSPALPIAKRLAQRAWDSLVLDKGKSSRQIPPLSPGLLCRSWLETRSDAGASRYSTLRDLTSCRDHERWSYDKSPSIAVTLGPTGGASQDGLWPMMWVVQDGEVIRRAVVDLEPIE